MTSDIKDLEDAIISAHAAGDQQALAVLVAEADRLQSMQPEATQAVPQDQGVMRDYVAPAVRGLLPTAVGAAGGAALGIPFGPGGMAMGARAGMAATEVGGFAGDVFVPIINKLGNFRFKTPAEAFSGLADLMGVPKSETAQQKMVEAGFRATGSTAGTMGLGTLMQAFGAGKVASIGQILSAAPREQLAAGLVGGAAAEGARGTVEEMGGGEGAQLAASLMTGIGAGMAAGRMASLKAGAGIAANPVYQAAQREGVNLPTSLLNPPTTLPGKYMQTLGSNIPLVGTSRKMLKVNEQVDNAVTSFLADYGVTHGADAPIAADLVDNLVATRGQQIRDLVDQKTKVISPLSAAGDVVPMSKATREIDAQITQLNKINPDAYAPIVDKLESFKNNIQGKSLDLIEANRKVLRGMKADPSLGVIKDDAMKAIDSTYNALRADMGDFIETQAGAATRSKWQNADLNLAKMTDDLGINSFKSALKDSAMSPSKVATMLRGKNDAEIEVLLKNTDAKGKDLIKGALLQEIANKSDTAGVISQQKFMTNLNKFSPAIRKTFSPDEVQRIKGLSDVLEATAFARHFAPDAPTGIKGVVPQSAILMGATAAGVIGKGLLVGAGWNLYESNLVRNLLQKIARNPPEKNEFIKRASTMLQVGYAKTIGKDMIKQGVPITFAPDSMKQEQVGQGTVYNDMAHGYRSVSVDGKKQRLYGPDNKLIGVFKNLDEARKFSDNQVVNKIKIPTK